MMVDVRSQRDRGPSKTVKAMRQKVAASRVVDKKTSGKKKAEDGVEVCFFAEFCNS
jgi:hypothetical protein